jgi:hypothetical protein
MLFFDQDHLQSTRIAAHSRGGKQKDPLMKPRAILTTKLLVVAAASLTGCTPRVDPASTTAAPERPAGPRTAENSAPPALPAESAAASPGEALPPGAVAPGLPVDERVALLKLQFELTEVELAEALTQGPRFRPLCDARGYPLVGNVARKGGAGEERSPLQASRYCGELRRLRRL